MSILRSQARRVSHSVPGEHTALDKLMVFVGVGTPPVAAAVAIYLLWHRGVGPVDLGLMGVMYFLTLLGITLGYHRLFTHRSFRTPAVVRFVLAVLGSMALQGPVIQWVAHHRRHHQVSDREGDPHSPHLHEGGVWNALKQAWHSHAGWLFAEEPHDLRRSVSDLLADPVVAFVDRTFWYWVALGLVLPGIVGYVISGTLFGALTGLLWGGLVRMAATHHVTGSINSVCHIWGAKHYQSSDESRNNPIFGVLALGEGWHNNHHAFPTSARHGLKWYQFDITWLTIRGMSLVGLAKDLRLPPASALRAKAVGSVVGMPGAAPAQAGEPEHMAA